MFFQNGRRILAALLLSVLLLVTSCATQAPSPYAQAQKESTQRNAPPAVAKDATQGSQFNKFFPKGSGGFQTVAAQEKKGFAEYKLKQGGKDVAVLSINDTISTPTAAAKFNSSTQKIAGYPAVNQGSNGTAILVGDRYQVKVQSRDASFTQSDREAWLQRFNLSGLARLK